MVAGKEREESDVFMVGGVVELAELSSKFPPASELSSEFCVG